MYHSNGAPPRRKERKVQVVFPHPDVEKHCAGVESLLLPSVPNHKLLFTASRDSTVRRWDVAGPEPVLEAVFAGHADWVNDLALIGDLLITCSNDQTVRLWKAGSDNGQHLHTLSYHSDYVTCLAAAPARSLVVSAGLRAEIFLLNIETGKHSQLYPRSPGSSAGVAGGSGHSDDGHGGGGAATSPTASPHGIAGGAGFSPHAPGAGAGHLGGVGGNTPVGGVGGGGVGGGGGGGEKDHPGSVYALALNPAGTLIAAGTSEALVRLLDPRTGKKITKLRGHQDTVRALLVNSDGSTIISGASDGTIKLWDVGMQRCVQTYNVHSDSVWALLSPDDSFSTIYSAGRDGALYRTRTQHRTSELLAVEDSPVTALALDPEGDPPGAGGVATVGVWTSTPSSSVNKWLVPRDPGAAAAAGGDGGRSFSVSSRTHGLSAALRNRMSLESHRQPLARSPAVVIPGVPALVAHEVLADRRHVLTRDSRGHVALWDVLTGAKVQSYGKVDMDAKRRELWEPRSVPGWFSADTRLGCLCISLEPGSAFAAEEYAQQLEYSGVPDDCKVNYGKLVLDCVFAKWRYKLAAGMSAGVPPPPPPGHLFPLPGPDGALPQLPPGTSPYYPDIWPKYWQIGALPAVMCSRHDGQRWRRLINAFDGGEAEPGEVPTWVGDVVLRGANVTPKEAKCAFVLLPFEGSNLPSLMQSKLNAPRILQVHKVAHYCCSKLQEQNIALEVRPVYLRRPAHAPPDLVDEPGAAPRPVLELTCNGVLVPFEMSLATVKKFIWKKSDDLVFNYKIRDPAHPAPMPQLAPSS
ncbi:hypothetical protein HYH02_003326 [Chlamydomonas schloesseri]|uniref:Uncharacterized protein n=1 Tax=Chlamydomonas schloesseri TaxID=2026947 RepID=A0A836BA31_9CHLO|nr:hypothetical protein HYH02_003326 [Chlamydomonas schloesseri]|eukprot:KAG2452302.1 hypothetical protein HYH02_003326 [Chlamydomonas schloesseri]